MLSFTRAMSLSCVLARTLYVESFEPLFCAFRGAVKGGFIWLKPKVKVFTSNRHPFEWFPSLTDFDKGAIERRITEITVVE